MKKFFVLICIVIMCAGCADMFADSVKDVSDKIYDDDNDDEYCDGMSDQDGDGYYSKYVYNYGKQFEKLMVCDGVQILLDYQIVTYDVLKVSDCLYDRISEEELISDIECIKLEEVQEEQAHTAYNN